MRGSVIGFRTALASHVGTPPFRSSRLAHRRSAIRWPDRTEQAGREPAGYEMRDGHAARGTSLRFSGGNSSVGHTAMWQGQPSLKRLFTLYLLATESSQGRPAAPTRLAYSRASIHARE